jgi:hypothetical protein
MYACPEQSHICPRSERVGHFFPHILPLAPLHPDTPPHPDAVFIGFLANTAADGKITSMDSTCNAEIPPKGEKLRTAAPA